MNKTFFAAALAGVLAFCGIALSATDPLPYAAKMDLNLKDNLTRIATDTGTEFGYTTEGSSEFVSLSTFMETAPVKGKTAIVSLGNVTRSDSIKFGFRNASTNTFEAAKVFVASDPGYSYSYNPDSFFSLDFDKDPFDGNIEIYVMGTPLPPSTVTLLVGLGAAAIFLLYNDRRRRMRSAGRA